MTNSVKNNTAYIGIGSNLGNKADNISKALNLIANSDNITLDSFSKTILTKPLGGVRQPDYANCSARLITSLSPEKLLNRLEYIESQLGRTTKGDGKSRIIDIDILLYENLIYNTKKLIIPHPRMHLRSFVLNGLLEMQKDISHPLLNNNIETLAKRLNGQDFVCNEKEAKLVSIAGVIGVGKTTAARALSIILDAELIEEEYDKNPYLDKVYAGQKELALKSELFFVHSSSRQLNKETIVGNNVYISDYIFDKARIYAQKWLSPDQIAQYNKEYPKFKAQAAKEAVILFLTDNSVNSLERIKLRNRPFEMNIDINFLENLEQEYRCFFQTFTDCPVIEVDVSKINLFNSDDVREIARQIKFYL